MTAPMSPLTPARPTQDYGANIYIQSWDLNLPMSNAKAYKDSLKPTYHPNCCQTWFHILVAYHGYPNGTNLKQRNGLAESSFKLYRSKTSDWGGMKGLQLAMYRWRIRTADQFRVAHVVLTIELVLHGRIILIMVSLLSSVVCLALLFLSLGVPIVGNKIKTIEELTSHHSNEKRRPCMGKTK